MLVAVIVFFVLNLSCIVYLQTRPMPSNTDIDAGEQEYRRVRAMLPDPTPRHDAATTRSLTTVAANETPQQKCDRLVREILAPNQILVRTGGNTHYKEKKVFAVFDKVKAIVALYDQGVRVSPEISGRYSPDDHRVLSFISTILASGLKADDSDTSRQTKYQFAYQYSAQNFTNTLEGLKFIRATDALLLERDFYSACSFVKDSLSSTSLALPREISALDLNLLAPRGSYECDRVIKLALDERRLRLREHKKFLKFGTAYRNFKQDIQIGADSWANNAAVRNALAFTAAIVLPPTIISSEIRKEIENEKKVETFATALANHNIQPDKIPGKTFDLIEAASGSEQIRLRRLAGALELRRGAAIPSPDKIGPDSYFYDPLTQRPYQMYQLPGANNTVQVVMCRTVAPYTQSHANNRPLNLKQANVMTFTLSANHPGLEAIPKAPQEIQLSLIYK